MVPRLNPDPLALPANRFPKVVQLVLHDIVDRIAGGVNVVANLLDDIVHRNPIDHLLTAFDRGSEPAFRAGPGPPCALGSPPASPASAFESAPTGPFRSFQARQPGERGTPACIPHERSDRAAARRPPPQQQSDSRANRRANQRRSQQVVLLLTLLVRTRFWVGLAGAVFPNRRFRLRRSPHRSSPPRQMPD